MNLACSEDGSVGKAVSAQVWGLEFRSQDPGGNTEVGKPSSNTAVGRQRLKISGPSWLTRLTKSASSRFSERYCLGKWHVIEKDDQYQPLAFKGTHIHMSRTHMWACIHTLTQHTHMEFLKVLWVACVYVCMHACVLRGEYLPEGKYLKRPEVLDPL